MYAAHTKPPKGFRGNIFLKQKLSPNKVKVNHMERDAYIKDEGIYGIFFLCFHIMVNR